MQRISRDQAHVYALDGSLEPVLRVAAGEPFAVETDDASSGLLTSGELVPTLENLPYARFSPARANPVGGPVYVEGVAARGRMRIEIDAITSPTRVSGTTGRRSRRCATRRPGPRAARHSQRSSATASGEAEVGRLRWPLVADDRHPRLRSGVGSALDDRRPGPVRRQPRRRRLRRRRHGLPHLATTWAACSSSATCTAARVTASGRASPTRAGPRSCFAPHPEPGEPLPLRARHRRPDRRARDREPLESAAHAGDHPPHELARRRARLHQREAYLSVGLNPEFRIRVYQMTSAYGLDYVAGASLPRAFVGLR